MAAKKANEKATEAKAKVKAPARKPVTLLDQEEVSYFKDTKNYFKVKNGDGIEAVLLHKDLARAKRLSLQDMERGHFLMSLVFIPPAS